MRSSTSPDPTMSLIRGRRRRLAPGAECARLTAGPVRSAPVMASSWPSSVVRPMHINNNLETTTVTLS